ncbi:MAG: hypothetical protein UT61_C0010G0011 [Candidatus Woesebacteria bacterium GW2011_GWA1_39_8]|jgi:hypothetical protein|uniref:DUF5666 domain-containing protein n=1 Tax=Candidatus Woesebacteria bacterium GW2011_GWA1_39_8 TaxID=1618552 RepID=A0A0G0PQQ4_9BACT|nr:MAG: hypothetical protein UT61_C0010G0011 [Candidatus Woesebacteria bacterium GW2011_GWA1_39_8]
MKKLFYSLSLISLILAEVSSPIFAQEAASQSDTIRQIVQEKIREALSKPKAYIGTITDKTDTGIQIKTAAGEIQQVALDSQNTSFVKVDKTSKIIKFDDVGIGDFIIAMGFVTNNEILDAKRIIVTTQEKEPERVAFLGEVVEATNNGMTLAKKVSGEEIIVTLLNTASITKESDGEQVKARYAEIDSGDILLVAGVKDGDSIEARSVHVVSFAPSTTPTP